MNFFELVKKRRSVRKFTSQPVSREILTRCLEAARLAPSACNSQPWQFIVVDDKDLRAKVAAVAFSGMYSINTHAKDAPVFVVVVRDKASWMAKVGGQLRNIQYSLVDIAIACEHFILQAADEGVGTCWLGWFDEGAVKKILGIPRNKRSDMMISMGYPADEGERDKVRKLLAEMSQFNTEKST